MATELSTSELAWLRQQRWFGAKERDLAGAEVVDVAQSDTGVRLEIVEVRFSEADAERYALVRTEQTLDAVTEPWVGELLLRRFREADVARTDAGGELVFHATRVLADVSATAISPIGPLGVEQSNSSLRFGDALILKLIRRLQSGIHPEAEISAFLTERTSFRHMPLLAGTASYVNSACEPSLLMVLQTLVPNVGDAWSTTLRRLDGVRAGEEMDAAVRPLARLGLVTAELHLALASHDDEPAFAPEPISASDVESWQEAAAGELETACAALERVGQACDELALRARLQGLHGLIGSRKTRHHGDYHLGQVLERPDGDFAIIDFEGEPKRLLSVRREKRSPLRDVAGLLRSLDYARHAACPEHASAIEIARLDAWYVATRVAFLDAYRGRVEQVRPDLLPAGAAFGPALAALELEKAAYEVLYELSHRPAYVRIPAQALAATI
jgi:trehalose synthase-fused probable maltokinase